MFVEKKEKKIVVNSDGKKKAEVDVLEAIYIINKAWCDV